MGGPAHSRESSKVAEPLRLRSQLSAAVTLLESAAQHDNPDAMYLLAEMNFYGNFTHPINYTAALREYHRLASTHGNATAQHMLGFMYATGLGAEPDQAKAMLYHTFAADAGNTKSEMTLAYRYHSGIATARDCDEAVYYYKKVADKAIAYSRTGPPGGYAPPNDAYRIADEEGGVYGEGASWTSSGFRAKQGPANSDTWAAFDDVLEFLDLMSKKGDIKATLSLAKLHYDGNRNLARDFKAAKDYFLEVARKLWPREGGVKSDAPPGIEKIAPKAAGYLGRMFLRGEGLAQDFRLARVWFRRGLDYGDPLCQYSMGLMYLNGLGVERNVERAVEFFTPAADQDMAAAQLRLGVLFLDQGDLTTSSRYLELAGRSGHMEALYYLAELSNQGLGRERSCGMAAVYYKMVAEKAENIHSHFREANEAHEDGDTQTAILDYMMAAEQGYEVGQANVAYLLDQQQHARFSVALLRSKAWALLARTNTTITRGLADAWLALAYWTRSAKQSNIDSLLKMGDYYLDGIGTEADAEKSAQCYQAAIETLQSAQALWNLGWMHENGIGIEQDFHLAKRFYDQSLETNKEAYLPARLALLKLRLRSWWNGVTGGEINGIHEEPSDKTRKKKTMAEWIHAFLEADAQAQEEREGRENAGFEDDLAGTFEDMPGEDPYDDIDDGTLESLVIITLAFALAWLVWYRQMRQQERRRAEAQGPGVQAQGQVQEGPGARVEQDRGVFPREGDPDWANWVAGGIGH